MTSAVFPLVFFDGDRDVDVGSVAVTASLDFGRFQSIVGRTIGVPPGQISTSLVRRRKARQSPDVRRREPIDESTDFAAVAAERDCFVLVAMKRPRRERRGRGRKADKKSSMTTMESATPTMILRRSDEFPAGMWNYDYERRMRSLEVMKERYLMSMMMDCPPSPAAAQVRYPAAMMPECGECAAAGQEGRSPAFHWCVYDEVVTVGFRSPAGPIERPVKKHVGEEASA